MEVEVTKSSREFRKAEQNNELEEIFWTESRVFDLLDLDSYVAGPFSI